MPYCRFLNKEMKNEFNEEVNRDSNSTKVTCLLEKSILFI